MARRALHCTTGGSRLVKKLSNTIKAHYQPLETVLGKQKLAQLYALLDAQIDMEQT